MQNPLLIVRTTRYTQAAFAQITTPSTDMSVLLDPDMPPGESLRESAKELREKAQRYLQKAELMEAASAYV